MLCVNLKMTQLDLYVLLERYPTSKYQVIQIALWRDESEAEVETTTTRSGRVATTGPKQQRAVPTSFDFKDAWRGLTKESWRLSMASKTEAQLALTQKAELQSYAWIIGVPHSANRATIAKGIMQLGQASR